MKSGEKIYRALKKQGLTNKEIAEAYILPHDLTKKEKAKADKELSAIIKKRREERKGIVYLVSCNRCDKKKRSKDLRCVGQKCTSCGNGVFLGIDVIPNRLIKK